MDAFSLNISPEELRAQIVERAAEKVAQELIDNYVSDMTSDIERIVEAAKTKKITEAVDAAIVKIIDPVMTQRVEDLVFQKTNQWGEKNGTPQTLTEFVIGRIDHFINEDVDHNGAPKRTDSYNWRASTSRLSFMIDKHLQYHIDTAVKQMLAEANSKLAGGIVAATKVSLQQALDGLKINVATK